VTRAARIGLAILSLVAGADAAHAAEPDCAAAVARHVQKHYEAVSDLAARFDQTTQVASLGMQGAGKPTRSSGDAVFAKPGRMRWHYKQPSESLVVSDGKTAWIYDKAANEAQHLPGAEGLMSGAAVQFLIGNGDLLRDFKVRALECDGDPVRLELVPVEPATYEKLEIAADRASGEVRETAIYDLVGNVTRIVFHDVQTNRHPEPGIFTFDPPKGVRVVELPPAAP
jgi:outer membrane lipoprotein carrier protein